MYKFSIEFGDPYDDGHGKYERYYISSNKPFEDVNKAYLESVRTYPDINPKDICSNYEESTIDLSTLEELVKHGILDKEVLEDEEVISVEEMWVCQDQFIDIILKYIKLSDSTLEFEIIEDNTPSLGTFGYGLFS